MKKFLNCFIFIILTIELWGNPLNMILEYKDIADFSIIEEKGENNFNLTISGLCMHSNYVVKNIRVITENDKVKVLIKLSIFKKKNETGRFSYKFQIYENTKQIVFGNEEIEIWKIKDSSNTCVEEKFD